MKRYWVLILAILPALLILACHATDESTEGAPVLSTGGADASVSSSASGTSGGGSCRDGVEGCSCATEGASIACGIIHRNNGNYETCEEGYSICTAGAWTSCEGDRDVQKGRIPIHAAGAPDASADAGTDAGLDAGTGDASTEALTDGGCSVCDPYCTVAVNANPPTTGGGLLVNDAGVSISASDGGVDAGPGACTTTGKTTTITGTVYDPAGNNPVYNATVFIPTSKTLPALVNGVSCDTCTSTVAAKSVATTAYDGTFTLTNVPGGTNIPIVVQMGKWRRELIISTVTPCAVADFSTLTCASGISAANCTLRLPKNHSDGWNASSSTYSAADMPKIAMVSGSADPLECMLLKAGVDPGEFSSYPSTGRFDYYQSPYSPGAKLAPAYGSAQDSSVLESTASQLANYDAVLFACEGGDKQRSTKVTDDYKLMLAYANTGGRLFLTHYSYSWIQGINTNETGNPWSVIGGKAWVNGTDPKDPWLIYPVTSFPKGAIFDNWLSNVGSEDSSGAVEVVQGRQNFTAVSNNVQLWMQDSTSKDAQFTFNTPYDGVTAGSCGRVVYTDYHASATTQVTTKTNTCATDSDCGYGGSCKGAVAVGTNLCVEPCNTSADCKLGSKKSTLYTCNASGNCILPCTSSSQCTGGETCTAGFCQGCTASSQCGGSLIGGAFCNTPMAGVCSPVKSTTYFPYECDVGELTAQESALEFMFFDLTSCTSLDSTPPPAPTPIFTSQTFTEDYSATCPGGTGPVWREVDYQSVIPSGTEIDFAGQTGDTLTDLTPASPLPITSSTSSTPLPKFDYGYIDTGSLGTGVFDTQNPPIPSQALFRLTVTLTPSTTASPTLSNWKVIYDCVPSQ